MQPINQKVKNVIKGTHQVPLIKVELYHKDMLTLLATIDHVLQCKVDTASSRKVLRTFSLVLDDKDGLFTPDPQLFDRNLLWYNKLIKIYAGYMVDGVPTYWPQGVFTIDSIKPSIADDGITVEVSGQDRLSLLIEDKFNDTYSVEDKTANESNNHALSSLGGTATASSYVMAGDEVQRQGQIYYQESYAYINGIKTRIENENTAESKDIDRILSNDAAGSGWRLTYWPKDGEIVTEIESELFIDLKSSETLQSIIVLLEAGTALKDYVYTSADLNTWESFTTTTITPTSNVRYIRFSVRKTTAEMSGGFTLAVYEVKVNTNKNFMPALAIDGDVFESHWRPRVPALDPDPIFTVDLSGGVRSINAIYLYWGGDSFDFYNRVNYYLEYSNGGSTWHRITDLNGLNETHSLFGDVEHVFDAINATHIRIRIRGRDGICKLRHVKAVLVTSTQTVDKVIKDVLLTSGIGFYNIPKTRRWIKSRQAQIGDEKEAFCRLVATSIGWIEPHMNENGVYITGPRDINPINPAWFFEYGKDNIFSFSPFFGNDINNVIVVVCTSNKDKKVFSVAIDNDPLSPTSVQNLGRRVKKYESESYNTEEKCEIIARQKLFERTRFKHQTSLPVTAMPFLQFDDVVKMTLPGAKLNETLYLITGYVTSYDASKSQFDTRFNVSQL